MKTFKFFAAALALVAGGALAACSNEEGGVTPPVAEGESYIRVNLTNPIDGRADVTHQGSEAEFTISSVAFLFFHDDGEAFTMTNKTVTGTATGNLVKPVISDLNQNDQSGVMSATLVLGQTTKPWKGVVPAKMLCIANVADYTAYENKSLTEVLNNISEENYYVAGQGFVMTSSTYVDNGQAKYWSDILAENICTTPADANQHPVVLHIERLAAKVQVLGQNGKNIAVDNLIPVGERDLFNHDGSSTSTQFYAHITGWDLNGTTTSAYSIKHIDPAANPFPGWSAKSFRSGWAVMNPTTAIETRFSWTGLSAEGNLTSTKYCLENTLDPNFGTAAKPASNLATSKATKVLLAATITDAEGNPQELVSWAGGLYKLDTFKALVAQAMNGTEDKVTLVRHNDFDTDGGSFHKVETYYDGEAVPAFGNVRYWEDGKTYYIVNIRHALNDGAPVYGVVRNHWYQVQINSIVGLGTPGGDEDTPGPENPDPELDTFVSAQVDILPWHVISYKVDVES